MNTPDHSDDELRCAEYALGVLDSDSRRALERDVQRDAALRATLESWCARFAPLAEDLPAIDPPVRVWIRVQRELNLLPSPTAPRAHVNFWNRIGLWRLFGIGASAVALLLLSVNIVLLRQTPRSTTVAAQSGYMVSTITRSDGVAHWTATVDVSRARMVVVPAVQPQLAAGRSAELWLIPPDGKPVPLGVVPTNAAASMPLSPRILAQMSTRAVLAVSVEPQGGSPTGQPTGPVIATGTMQIA